MHVVVVLMMWTSQWWESASEGEQCLIDREYHHPNGHHALCCYAMGGRYSLLNALQRTSFTAFGRLELEAGAGVV